MRILIVEDEMMIAETIKIYIEERGHVSVGIVISYDEALEEINTKEIDLVLIDVRLYGKKSGIDLAIFLSENTIIPYVFLTSQFDKRVLENAMATAPSGYLTKPIQKETLWTTIELALNNHALRKGDKQKIIKFNDGKNVILLAENSIDFIKSDHVYLNIHAKDQKFLTRQSLLEFGENLSDKIFFQCHRSYIVNVSKITHIGSNHISIGSNEIPISRIRRRAILTFLEAQNKSK